MSASIILDMLPAEGEEGVGQGVRVQQRRLLCLGSCSRGGKSCASMPR